MISKFFLIFLLVMNLTAFFAYGADKRRAVKHQWRISEAALLSLAAIGGALGAFCGMQVFHHKTKHRKFTIGVPLFLLVQGGLFLLFILL